MDIDRLLEQMVKFDSSDLHLQEGHKPSLRIDGQLRRLDTAEMTREEMMAAVRKTLYERQVKRFEETNEGDGSYLLEGQARFRINAYMALNRINLAIRLIPLEVPRLDSLNLPATVPEIALSPRGLVLVTGVTGSGKSTSLAAMLRHINENKRVKIISLEDPVEFLHTEEHANISQREVGIDTESYTDGMKQVFRQNPDVILIGEIRDQALSAAETGHLVFTTLHTADAPHTITRVLSFFPPHDHNAVRELLAGVMVATTIRARFTGPRAALVSVGRPASVVSETVVSPSWAIRRSTMPVFALFHPSEVSTIGARSFVDQYLLRQCLSPANHLRRTPPRAKCAISHLDR